MDLFIETPKQVNDRLERERRSQDAWLRAMQEQYAAQQAGLGAPVAQQAGLGAPVVQQAGSRVPVDQQIGSDAPSAQRSGHEGSSERHRACETYAEQRGEHEASHAPSQAGDGYSVAQDAYREELAFQRRRARRRRIGACLRVLALIVLIPLGLAAVFVGSYVLTCIINGATPEEVLDVLTAMPSRVESFVRSVMAM